MRFFECCDCGSIHQRETFGIVDCRVCEGTCFELLASNGINLSASSGGAAIRANNHISVGMALSDYSPTIAPVPFVQTALVACMVCLFVAGIGMFASSDRAMAKCQQSHTFDACFETLHR